MREPTKKDKLALLKRLDDRVKKWRLRKSLPAIVLHGLPDFSQRSPEFQEWLKDANEAIRIVFGEYSHYVADFNDIEYSELLSHLIGDKKANEANLWKGLDQAQLLLRAMIGEVQAEEEVPSRAPTDAIASNSARSVKPRVFIGHGRSPVWLAVKAFLEKECGLQVVCFESESRASESIVSVLEQMISEAGFAVIVLTAEDATADGQLRARQNVIHEAGLAQGKLGFKKVVILKQDGVEELTNLAGLQYISFKDKIEQSFYDLGRALKGEGL